MFLSGLEGFGRGLQRGEGGAGVVGGGDEVQFRWSDEELEEGEVQKMEEYEAARVEECEPEEKLHSGDVQEMAARLVEVASAGEVELRGKKDDVKAVKWDEEDKENMCPAVGGKGGVDVQSVGVFEREDGKEVEVRMPGWGD